MNTYHNTSEDWGDAIGGLTVADYQAQAKIFAAGETPVLITADANHVYADGDIVADADSYTIRDLVQLIEAREAELAPGSETSVLTAFVAKYDCTQRCLEERGDEDVSADEYTAWVEAYNHEAQLAQ